jgi:hypothetical protein
VWGDSRPGCRWHKITAEVIYAAARKEPCHQHVYVYGRNNLDLVNEHLPHWTATMVDPHPFPDGEEDRFDGRITRIPWHYKHELILRAVRDHGPVIYCDWDVQVVADQPEEIFRELEQKQFALTAFYYKRPRPFKFPRNGRERHINASGAVIYTRNQLLPETVLEKMRRMECDWHWHDEMAMNDAIDEIHGGWPGEDEWLRRYENPVVGLGDRRSPWGKSTGDCVAGDKFVRVRRWTPVPFEWHQMLRHY